MNPKFDDKSETENANGKNSVAFQKTEKHVKTNSQFSKDLETSLAFPAAMGGRKNSKTEKLDNDKSKESKRKDSGNNVFNEKQEKEKEKIKKEKEKDEENSILVAELVEDEKNFRKTQTAMSEIGISVTEQTQLFKILGFSQFFFDLFLFFFKLSTCFFKSRNYSFG